MIHGTVCVHSVCGFVVIYLYSSINFFCRTGSDVSVLSATSSSDSTTILPLSPLALARSLVPSSVRLTSNGARQCS